MVGRDEGNCLAGRNPGALELHGWISGGGRRAKGKQTPVRECLSGDLPGETAR